MTLLEAIAKAATELGVPPDQITAAYEAAMKDSAQVAATMKQKIPPHMEARIVRAYKQLLVDLADRTPEQQAADEERLQAVLREQAESN